jgi:hypothetical protein
MIYTDLLSKLDLPGVQKNPYFVSYGCTIIGIIIPASLSGNDEKIKQYAIATLNLYRHMKMVRKKPQDFEKTSKIHLFVADSVESFNTYLKVNIRIEARRTVIAIPPNEDELAIKALKPFLSKLTNEDLLNRYQVNSKNIGMCLCVCDKQTHRFGGDDAYKYSFF